MVARSGRAAVSRSRFAPASGRRSNTRAQAQSILRLAFARTNLGRKPSKRRNARERPPADLPTDDQLNSGSRRMKIGWALRDAGLGVAVILMMAGAALAASEEEAPKRGGILTYMIPADAPPSFDGHREGTFATLQAMAPFYSVLIRINPENPGSTTDFVCDLCTAMPQPTDG